MAQIDASADSYSERFAELARAVYGLAPTHLEPLPESDPAAGAAGWRVDSDIGSDAILRAYSEGYEPPDHLRYFYPSSFVGDTWQLTAWLESRAATLLALEAAGYQAPRVLRPLSGDAASEVGTWGDWHVLATGFIAGSVLDPTLAQLARLGETLGHLHALPRDLIAAGKSPGLSYWASQYAVPGARAKFAAVADRLPEEWRPLYAGMRDAVEGIGRRVERGELVETIIHGDVWAANAVETPSGQIQLIDWYQGGLGPAVLDLARLLHESHLDADLPPGEPLAWHIHPDPARIAAVVDGYARARTPTAGELDGLLDALLDALRFGVAFIGALHFEQALLHPVDSEAWRAGMQRRYERLRNRFETSEAVAELARARFRESGR